MKLSFLRHGETQMNRDLCMQGYGSDYPLNDRGRRQAGRAARRLSGEEITAIIASDLSRAFETAEIVAAEVGLPVRPDVRLREQDIGDWEGNSLEDTIRVGWFDELYRGPAGPSNQAHSTDVMAVTEKRRARVECLGPERQGSRGTSNKPSSSGKPRMRFAHCTA